MINAWWVQMLIHAHQHYLLLCVFELGNLHPSHPLQLLYDFKTLKKTWAGDFVQEQINLFMPMLQAYAHILWVHAQAKETFLTRTSSDTSWMVSSSSSPSYGRIFSRKTPKANSPWKDLNKSKVWLEMECKCIHDKHIVAGGAPFPWERNKIHPSVKTCKEQRSANTANPQMWAKGKQKATNTLKQLQGNELFTEAAILHKQFYSKV
ncbi:hypothetical protein DACRYDRAFT_16312 [Dacryopinax primogenitus]|uniref:Uncharacterized protein n=1 Tax=Dacryopinax primogenitus (strain DJM 731) TaxID=1858805 RepID=M5GAF2_DACPD|nr:uncharacterized protein DACRYDRAFT_16312 [Dacryopinax primogenitus]EJU00888.1 hypothetical protein DACRYDRAFT_16312 [Dacryopinax primogenitus]